MVQRFEWLSLTALSAATHAADVLQSVHFMLKTAKASVFLSDVQVILSHPESVLREPRTVFGSNAERVLVLICFRCNSDCGVGFGSFSSGVVLRMA